MTPSTILILSLIILGVLLLLVILLMVKTFDILTTMRNSYKNSFVPLNVQLVKRRKAIEFLIQEMAENLIANGKQSLLDTLQRACHTAAQAESRISSRSNNGRVVRRLARTEDAMVYALCRLIESLQSIDDPRVSEWMEKLRQPLLETEENIEAAVEKFNTSLEGFNKTRSSFPFVLVSALLGFRKIEPMKLKKACRFN